MPTAHIPKEGDLYLHKTKNVVGFVRQGGKRLSVLEYAGHTAMDNILCNVQWEDWDLLRESTFTAPAPPEVLLNCFCTTSPDLK